MLEGILLIEKQINDMRSAMLNELRSLEASGHARHFHWMDKYDSYSTWVISENKELLAKIYIDGWSDDNGYALGDEHLPRDHPELYRIEMW